MFLGIVSAVRSRVESDDRVGAVSRGPGHVRVGGRGGLVDGAAGGQGRGVGERGGAIGAGGEGDFVGGGEGEVGGGREEGEEEGFGLHFWNSGGGGGGSSLFWVDGCCGSESGKTLVIVVEACGQGLFFRYERILDW